MQVLRYALYGKDRSTFADASAAHTDWGSKIRALFPHRRPRASARGAHRSSAGAYGDASARRRTLIGTLVGGAR